MSAPDYSNKQYRATGMIRILRGGDPGVLLVAALLLVGGWVLRCHYADRTATFTGLGLTLQYPESWGGPRIVAGEDGERMMVLADVLSAGPVKPAIKISSEAAPQEVKANDIPSYLLLDRQQSCKLFHLISQKMQDRGSAGIAHRLSFAHAINPAATAEDPAATDTPVVLRVSSLVLVRDKKLLRVDVEQTLEQHKADPGLASRVLASVKVR